MNICEHLTCPAELFPDQEAIVYGDHRYSYSTLESLSHSAAEILRERGIKRGDRVGIMLPNVPAFIVWYFASVRCGAIAVSISTRLTASEVAFILDDCGASVFVADNDKQLELEAELPTCVDAALSVSLLGDACNNKSLNANAESTTRQFVNTRPEEPAVILYTSGTTGFAKGATLSHENVRATVHAFNHLCQMNSSDRILLSVPLFHCYGQNALLNSGFNVAATIILQQRFDLNESKQLIKDERVSKLFGVPTTFQLLEEFCSPDDLDSVDYCFSAAATLPIQVSRKWQDKFGMPIYEGYGLTETAPFASYNHRLKFVPGSIGTPVDLVEMKIVDTETGETCPPGELGEIAIRGPNVMLGYWNRPDDTAEAIREGWFHSGDIGRMDSNGFFYIVDRVKDMIAIGGMKVFPAEVERVLLDHEVVNEAAVVGFPDDVLGEKVVAFIVANQRDDIADPNQDSANEPRLALQEHCNGRIASYKMPRQFVFVDELPRNPAGKVLKTKLREFDLSGVRTSQSSGEASESILDKKVATSNSTQQKGPSSIPGLNREDAGAWLKELRDLFPADRARKLTNLVQHTVQDVLGCAELPEPSERFLDIGLDSLMIVDLRDRLQLGIGDQFELPATLVFDCPSIGDLTDYLLEELNLENGQNAAAQSSMLSEDVAGNEQDQARATNDSDVENKTGESIRDVDSLSEEQALEELLREINE